LFNTDGSTSTSRVRWIANGTLNENVTAGGMIELTLPLSNPQGSMTLSGIAGQGLGEDGTEIANGAFATRHTFVWVNHKRMGKISLGQTNSASNGRSETSFSGTNMVDLSSGSPFGDGIAFIDTTRGTASPSVSSVTVGAAYTNLDGRSRTDVLRYDTPRFAGLSLATSYIAGGDWDVGADYRVKKGALTIRIQAQFNNSSAGASVGDVTITESSISMSAGALHDSGLNGAFAFGKAELGGTGNVGAGDPTFRNINFGYRAKIFGVGGTNFSFNWNHSEDLQGGNGNSSGDAVGFTIAQIFNPIGANMALTYRKYSYDDNTNTFDDIDIFGLQTVFNF
jgi:hypothetical protein